MKKRSGSFEAMGPSRRGFLNDNDELRRNDAFSSWLLHRASDLGFMNY